jgi:hypothetical protein
MGPSVLSGTPANENSVISRSHMMKPIPNGNYKRTMNERNLMPPDIGTTAYPLLTILVIVTAIGMSIWTLSITKT